MASRTISAYALASLAQAKRACGVGAQEALLESGDVYEDLLDTIEWASAEVERYLCRQIVTRSSAQAPAVEYHTADPCAPTVLRLRQYPVISITSIDEGYWDGGTWTSSETLTTGDYLARENGELVRLDTGGAVCSWPTGLEKVRVTYRGGYATTADVPAHIRRVALDLAGRRWAMRRRGQPGASSISDAMGTVTRFLPAELLKLDHEALQSEVRFTTTGRAA
jgi:hypothetical protein